MEELKVEKQDVLKIWELYFDQMFNYDQIIAYFNNKYTHSDIKKAINKRYEKTYYIF